MRVWVLLSKGRLSELGVGINCATPADSVQKPLHHHLLLSLTWWSCDKGNISLVSAVVLHFPLAGRLKQ